MNDLALATPRSESDTPGMKTTRRRSAVLGALAVVVLGGATTALFALEACAENSPAQPVPVTSPTTTTSSSAKPPATAPTPAPAPAPSLPPPPT